MPEIWKVLGGITGALVAGYMVAGCASSGETDGPAGPATMSELGVQQGADGTVVERFDLNGDKKPNLWKIYRVEGDPEKPEAQRRILIRTEIDLNNDGKVDIRRHVDAEGRTTKEEMDLDFDGRVDAVAYYKDGQVVKREMDLSLDGKPDITKYYEDGTVVRKERDTDQNGKVDVWEYYEEGRLVRIGRDRDGDGKPELFEDAPEEEQSMPAGAPGS